MRLHEIAVMRIGRYLLATKDRGMIYRPDPKRGLEVFADADFADGWDSEDAENADNVYSCTGYVICYAGCVCVCVCLDLRKNGATFTYAIPIARMPPPPTPATS